MRHQSARDRAISAANAARWPLEDAARALRPADARDPAKWRAHAALAERMGATTEALFARTQASLRS